MLRRRQINAASDGRSMRFVADVLETIRWRLERAGGGCRHLFARAGDVASWPFERATWAFERGALWPARERIAGRGPAGHWAGAAALGASALAAVLAGVLLIPGGNGGGEPNGTATRVAVVTPAPTPAPKEQTSGPVLKGVAPRFGVGAGTGVKEGADSGAADLNAGAASEAVGASEQLTAPEEAGATTSSAKPEPAGPAAMKVARRFSQAFVFYEIGKRPAQAKAVFGETATPQLAKALEERPPRLPATAKVPKASVLNLVPGPRLGKAYTVSVSLLRVGVTSELRLSLQQEKGGTWSVAQVLG